MAIKRSDYHLRDVSNSFDEKWAVRLRNAEREIGVVAKVSDRWVVLDVRFVAPGISARKAEKFRSTGVFHKRGAAVAALILFAAGRTSV